MRRWWGWLGGALALTPRRTTADLRRPLVGPDDPQPLDDDLPAEPNLADRRARRILWVVAIAALAFRVLLLPLGHAWDLTVDYNVFIDLAHNHSPYDTMTTLSHIARAANWGLDYEYYAYPPVPLYIYWPLAHLFTWLHPTATYFFAAQNSFAQPSLPWDFYLWLKLPIWIADLLVAAVLARMTGTIRSWRDYLLNPYVLLVSGAWTFDSITLLGLVLGVYWLQRGKMVHSGLALAFGTMVKFFPALAVPTLLLFLIKKQRPIREIALFLGAFAAGCLVLVGPFAAGVIQVLTFHDGRTGGGMTWQMIARLWLFWPTNADLGPQTLAIASFGTPMLAIAMLLAYWYAFISKPMGLIRMVVVTYLAFFLGSKLVNEQYALLVLPFAMIEARRVGGAWKWFARLLWIIPFCFAVFHVPLERFAWLLLRTVYGPAANVITFSGNIGLSWLPWDRPKTQQYPTAALAVAFWLLCLVAVLWPMRPAIRGRPRKPEPLPPDEGALALAGVGSAAEGAVEIHSTT